MDILMSMEFWLGVGGLLLPIVWASLPGPQGRWVAKVVFAIADRLEAQGLAPLKKK